MSKRKKLTRELLQQPSRFKWDDLVYVMKCHGFNMKNARGGGSGRNFFNPETKQIAKWHEPHPDNEVKKYVVNEAIALIKEQIDE